MRQQRRSVHGNTPELPPFCVTLYRHSYLAAAICHAVGIHYKQSRTKAVGPPSNAWDTEAGYDRNWDGPSSTVSAQNNSNCYQTRKQRPLDYGEHVERPYPELQSTIASRQPPIYTPLALSLPCDWGKDSHTYQYDSAPRYLLSHSQPWSHLFQFKFQVLIGNHK